MSEAWAGGSTRAWRRLRQFVLQRDRFRCQVPGCPATADQVHHLDGAARGILCPPDRLVAICAPHNNAIGDPTRPNAPQFFPTESTPGHRRPVPSLPEASRAAVEPRPEVLWDPATLAAHPWLTDLLDIPEDAAPPLYMSPVPPDATGSYGDEAIAWIEESQRITLRWWQRLAITRQLEHRADGTLCHRVVLESAPRRAGKSVRVRGIALWRMAHPDLFGETQTVVHTGSDVAICREIQRGAWRWAEEDAGWTVSRANGKEALETPVADRWLVRAQGAVYGYDVCLGIVDEAWNVKPDTVDEGLEPATLERLSPQIHLTSTAHRRATSLMKSRLLVALTAEADDNLLLVWAAPADADPGDPEVWRAASPHWSEDRRKLIAGKYAKAMAGEADPQADDPDPMAGFTAQYLNVWQLDAGPGERGVALVSEDEWSALRMTAPDGPPDAAAIESWFGDGVSLALAWKVGDQIVVSATDHADMGEAAEALRASGVKRPPTVGASLTDDPALQGLRPRPGQGRTGDAVRDIGTLLAEGFLIHDGAEHLAAQVLAARTLPGADGPRVSSKGRADALKAVAWAAADARRPSLGRPRLIVAH